MKSKLKKAAIIFALVLLGIAGIGMVIYPAVGNYYDEITQSKAEAVYMEEIHNTKQDELAAALDAAHQFNQQLTGQILHEAVKPYDGQLDLQGNGVMGYLCIPCIGVSLPIYHGVSDETMTQGAGHLPTSSLPVGGESAHCVLSAHAGVADKRLFTDLEKMIVGDTFSISVCGKELTYRVDQIQVVLPHEIDCLSIVEGEDYVTLLTCTPYGINTHRLLVRGTRITPEEAAGEAAEAPTEEAPRMSAWVIHYLEGIAVSVVATLICVLAILAIRKRRRAHG